MKRIHRVLLILIVTVIALPVQAAAAQGPCLKAASVSVRAGPGGGYTRVGLVRQGECITVIGLSADGQWYQVPQGWVWAAPHLWIEGSGPPAAVGSTAGAHAVAVESWVSNTAPSPFDDVAAYILINIDGLPRAGIPVEFAWLFGAGPAVCGGITDSNGLAACFQNAGAGPAVEVRASFRAYGRNYTFTRSFAPNGNCDPSYPDFCLPPETAGLQCRDIPYREFVVRPPDPHGFDADGNGTGCEL